MLKRLGFPLIALAAILSLGPKPADARVHFGVYLGGPPYVAPVPDPYYYAPYSYYYDPYYNYPPVFGYGPTLVYPRIGGHFDRDFHGRREFHGDRNFHGGQSFGRGGRVDGHGGGHGRR